VTHTNSDFAIVFIRATLDYAQLCLQVALQTLERWSSNHVSNHSQAVVSSPQVIHHSNVSHTLAKPARVDDRFSSHLKSYQTSCHEALKASGHGCVINMLLTCK
jgi:hypothetical protein